MGDGAADADAVLLVVDASGSAASAAATVKGFMTLREDSGIAGVLVNRVSGTHHYELVRDAVAHYTACRAWATSKSM